MKRELLCCSGVHNGALAQGTLPPELKIFNWGKNPSLYGDVIVDDHQPRRVAFQARAAGQQRLGVVVPGRLEDVVRRSRTAGRVLDDRT